MSKIGDMSIQADKVSISKLKFDAMLQCDKHGSPSVVRMQKSDHFLKVRYDCSKQQDSEPFERIRRITQRNYKCNYDECDL